MRALEPGVGVRVEVPATSANLGPGFDACGLALDWRERVELTVIDRGFDIDVTGEGAEQIPRDESHLIIRSALTGLADLGVSVPGLRLSCRNTVPHGRGLGSSSAAIVAGLIGAAGLAGVETDRGWLLGHANAIEGHPDNVAAAIHGGFVLAWDGREGITAVSPPVHPEISAAVFVPQQPVATSAARGLLPESVPLEDAAANSGRAALLVYALTQDPARLFDGTRDWLHQSYRSTAMPRSYELVASLRCSGHAAFVSGAGPTVAVLGAQADLEGLDSIVPDGFVLHRLAVGGPASVARI